MKIKTYSNFIYEKVKTVNGLTREQIYEWLNIHNKYNSKFLILDDLTVNIFTEFHCSDKNIQSIPIQFNRALTDFGVDNNKLTSLKGCPNVVGGDFFCNGNKLTSLEYCPQIIQGEMWSYENPLITINGLNPKFDLNKLILEEKDKQINLCWTWLETNLSTDPSLIKYNIKWIKNHKDTMPESFKRDFEYLLEINDY